MFTQAKDSSACTTRTATGTKANRTCRTNKAVTVTSCGAHEDPLTRVGAMSTSPTVIVGQLAALQIDVNEAVTQIVLQLRTAASQELRTVTLRGVTSLRISQQWSNWPMTIELVDISDRGWEGIRYAVTEAEDGVMSCYCEEVEEAYR